MRVLIANDHGAIELKQGLVRHLEASGHQVENLGVDRTDSVDYPDIARQAAERFKQGGFDFGILCCGSGIGIGMAANKVPGIRCAQVFDLYTAQMCKRHNNANFLSFGGRVDYAVPVPAMVDAYIEAVFEGDRHQRRVEKLDALC